MFQGVLAEHARRNVIGSEELDNAGFMIHELEEIPLKIMNEFDQRPLMFTKTAWME